MCTRRAKKVLKKKWTSKFSISIQNFQQNIQKSRILVSKMLVMGKTGIWSDDISP